MRGVGDAFCSSKIPTDGKLFVVGTLCYCQEIGRIEEQGLALKPTRNRILFARNKTKFRNILFGIPLGLNILWPIKQLTKNTSSQFYPIRDGTDFTESRERERESSEESLAVGCCKKQPLNLAPRCSQT